MGEGTGKKCVVCGSKPALRHFVCPECISAPEMNHNAVGAFLRGVGDFLDGMNSCPYVSDKVNNDNPVVPTYMEAFARLWHRGFNSARTIKLDEKVREVYGDRWQWEWHDRKRPPAKYLGHGKFTYKKE
jgi:hypothetical protein